MASSFNSLCYPVDLICAMHSAHHEISLQSKQILNIILQFTLSTPEGKEIKWRGESELVDNSQLSSSKKWAFNTIHKIEDNKCFLKIAWDKDNQTIINLQPVFIKSFSELALCVPLARLPKATHNAVSIALFPPTPIKKANTQTTNSSSQATLWKR